MRNISSIEITDAVKKMCINANCHINADILDALKTGSQTESTEVARQVLSDLVRNSQIADEQEIPICQDTGMAVFFVKLGQDVHIDGETLNDAINRGVAEGYTEGYLRKSVVRDPIRRENTGDNTPAVIYCEMVKGEQIEITFAPKGFGSENKSALKMLNPSDGLDGAIEFIIDTVRRAGANPCPPMVVGVGLGGTMDKAAQLAKLALTRDINSRNPDNFYAELENRLLSEINALGIGPAGLGGSITALGVNIEAFPTHIAGLPVAVNISCHATRHAHTVI